MGKKNQVLVLASRNDPQLAMLNGLPHAICTDIAACAQGWNDATVILQWSGTRELLRSLFARCPEVRWVHSRGAGVDNLLFPELVESEVLLTNGSGVFSASLGEFVLAAILYFAKDFRRMVRNRWRLHGNRSMWKRLGERRWGFWAMATLAERWRAVCTRWECVCSRRSGMFQGLSIPWSSTFTSALR